MSQVKGPYDSRAALDAVSLVECSRDFVVHHSMATNSIHEIARIKTVEPFSDTALMKLSNYPDDSCCGTEARI